MDTLEVKLNFDAIQITTNGDVVFSQDINVAGNLTVNGTTTYLNTETVTLEDPILVLGSVSGKCSTFRRQQRSWCSI
jgi:hypothetical protein